MIEAKQNFGKRKFVFRRTKFRKRKNERKRVIIIVLNNKI